MSNLPALKNSFPSPQEFTAIKELGAMAVKSGLLPTSVNTPEKAVIIILKGRELGIPPMQAFSSIAVVNGKPTMSAELMAAMIYKNVPGAIINYLKSDNNECVIEAQRPGGKPTRFSFSMEDAKRANLVGKGPWQTYPAAMLRARCLSAMARAMFADALSGVVYTPEELGAEIDDDGNVLSVPPEVDAPPVVDVTPESFEPPHKKSATSVDLNVLGDFRVSFGIHSGKRLKDLSVGEWVRYLEKLEYFAEKNGEPLSDQAHYFKVALTRYRAARAGEYVIPFGTLKDLRIKEVELSQLTEVAEKVQSDALKKSGELSEDEKNFLACVGIMQLAHEVGI
jgi:hypothetical protein